MTTSLLLLFLFLTRGWAAPEPLNIDESLNIDNGVEVGEWGSVELCGTDLYAFAFEIKYEDINSLGDDTAMNALKLYCKNDAGTSFNTITSLEGTAGSWRGIKACPQGSFPNYLIGFRAYVSPDQGAFLADWGMEYIQMMCADFTILDGNPGYLHDSQAQSPVVKRETVVIEGREMEAVHINTKLPKERNQVEGSWSEWMLCNAANRVCGLQTRVDVIVNTSDDFGMTDLVLFCCSYAPS